ncbi:MAG: site-2 protease family protein [Actinomycetota bacterium]|nr:site-2 protease family protein [Actinomycetota bacterium]
MSPNGVRIGRVMGVPIFVAPTWFLFAFFIVASYGPALTSEVGARSAYGAAASFALLLGLSVLLHEIGHCVVARAYGLPVRSITITLLAGFTEITEPPQTPARESAVAAAGPAVSFVLAGVGLACIPLTPSGGLTHLVVQGLTVTNAVVAVFNLLPGLPLDGGRVLRAAVWRLTGDADRATRASAWSGRVVAVLVVPGVLLGLLPLLGFGGRGVGSVVFAALISVFIYNGATAALRRAELAVRLPGISAAALARPAIAVPSDTPLAEALRRANDVGAGGVVVVDSADRVEGVVSEAAVLATPEARRPWVSAGALARRVSDEAVLSLDLVGEQLLTAMQAQPAAEYVLREGARLYVLLAQDVAKAVGR